MKSLPLDAVRVLVVIVIGYTAATLWRDARRETGPVHPLSPQPGSQPGVIRRVSQGVIPEIPRVSLGVIQGVILSEAKEPYPSQEVILREAKEPYPDALSSRSRKRAPGP